MRVTNSSFVILLYLIPSWPRNIATFQKKDLIDAVGVSSSTIAKMGKGENVSLDVLERLCAYFDCNIGDVVSFEKEEGLSGQKRWTGT